MHGHDYAGFTPSFTRPLAVCLFALGVILVSPSLSTAGPRIVSDAPSEEAPSPAPAAEPTPTPTPVPAAGPTAVVVVSEHEHRAAIHNAVRGFELGIRGGVFLASDDWIDPEGSGFYGGGGMVFGYRFNEPWAIAFGFDHAYRGVEEREISEHRFSFDFGARWYLFDPTWAQMYISFGMIGAHAIVDFEGDESEYSEFGGFGGVGLDVYLGNWRINSELRAIGLGRDEDSGPLRDPSSYTRTAPDARGAMQLTTGVSYKF